MVIKFLDMIVLLILGIIMFLVAVVLKGQNDQKLVQGSKILRLTGIALAVTWAATSCFVQIEPGFVGVQTLFGKVQEGQLNSGLNFINPVVNVVDFDIKTQNYTMSGLHDEGDQAGDDAIRVLSNDGLELVIDLTVLYKIKPSEAPRILRELGTEYKKLIVRPIARTKIRDNAVAYNAVDLYSTKRASFQKSIFDDIEQEFKSRGIILENLLIRNISLPTSVKTAIEAKINAEQEAQKMEYVLQKEKQEAERKRVEASGIADYQRIINANLTSNQLQYESIKAYKEMANSSNAKIIVMDGKSPLILGNN
jgi:regulator of protease activity HflC (stomatin/prohibitin superfamily)